MPTRSLSSQLQQHLAAHLRRGRGLMHVPLLLERLDDPKRRLQQSIQRAHGPVVILWHPRPLIADTSQTTATFTAIEVRLRITASAADTSQPGLLNIAEEILRRLQGYSPPILTITAPLRMREEFGWVYSELPDQDGRLSVDLIFHTTGTYSA